MRVNDVFAELVPIFAQYPIIKVLLFGSRARGDFQPNSDYDFLVEFTPGSSLLDWGGLIEDLMEHYKTDVDVVSYQSLRKANPEFRESVMKDAKVIYDTH